MNQELHKPTNKQSQSEEVPQAQADSAAATPPKRTAKKILVVDDDPLALKAAEEILRKGRYEVITLSNPKFVFKTIKQEQPDLIALDIIMRPVDGYSLCAEIKKAYGDRFPVLLCTSLSYEQDLIKNAYKDFGADDYTLKPLQADVFLTKIKALLKKRPGEKSS